MSLEVPVLSTNVAACASAEVSDSGFVCAMTLTNNLSDLNGVSPYARNGES